MKKQTIKVLRASGNFLIPLGLVVLIGSHLPFPFFRELIANNIILHTRIMFIASVLILIGYIELLVSYKKR